MSMMCAACCWQGRHPTNRMEVSFNIGAGMCLSLLVDYPSDPRRSRHRFRRCFAAELPFPSADAFSLETVFTAAFFGVTIRTRCRWLFWPGNVNSVVTLVSRAAASVQEPLNMKRRFPV